MKLLNFSLNQFDELNLDSAWEKKVLDFWEDWKSDNEYVTVQTSGSTGKPKKIKLPKKAMRLSAKMTGEFFNLTQGKSSLLCLPMDYIAAKMMFVRAAELKLKLFLTEPKSEITINRPIDFVPMTPMQVEKSTRSINQIKTLLIGGAPLSNELKNFLSISDTDCYESYGMTETITHIALKKISGDYFQILPGVSIRQDDRECLVIQTPYFEKEIITNDIVEIKENNHFKWIGRFDNVINSGGVKLFPEEIEKKLKPFIDNEFIITSVPNQLLGQKLVLVIEGEKRTNFTIDYKSAGLTKFEAPKEIYFVNKFPKTESGKIRRKEIAEILLNHS